MRGTKTRLSILTDKKSTGRGAGDVPFLFAFSRASEFVLFSISISRLNAIWRICRSELVFFDQKVLSAKIPFKNMLHTDGITSYGKEVAREWHENNHIQLRILRLVNVAIHEKGEIKMMYDDIMRIIIILIMVILLAALLIHYLEDYTLFFDRLFGTMPPEEYYKERNYVGLYRRFKDCVKIDELGWSEKTSADIAEICRFASLADPERWSDLANPDVVSALAFLASMGITVNVWAKFESTDCPFRIHLYHMDARHRKIIGKYQDKYCGDAISSQSLIQFTNELKEDLSHVK